MKYLLIIATVVIAMLFLFWKDVGDLLPADKSNQNGALKGVDIVQKWDMPDQLKEVSGIAYLNDQRFAAVQDETGTIYIYDHSAQKIEREIRFAGSGDFEGLTVVDSMAYVVNGSGTIFEVDMRSQPERVKEYITTLTENNNVEGLCYDAGNNRLLLTVKDKDPNSDEYKGIYAFDLSTKSFSASPVFKIQLNDPVFKGGKKNKSIMPAAIGIHPSTKNIYIVDGPNARLLLMDPSGNILSLIDLGKKFSQPEGISFSPSGATYISNEGNKDPGNIIEVKLTK